MVVDIAVAPRRPVLLPAVAAMVVGALVLVFALDTALGSLAALGAVAVFAYLAHARWLAACAAVWVLVFLSVLIMPGPYDSWAGRAAIPVLAGYVLCFLGGWALVRWPLARRLRRRAAPLEGAAPARSSVVWPSEFRLRGYLLVLLAVAGCAGYLRYHGIVPPVFADNPDAARAALSQRANIVEGLLSEAWTLGMAISLLRALIGGRNGRWLYLAATAVFAFGAALGASKNSVLVGIVPAIIAALAVPHPHRPGGSVAARLARFRPSLRTGLVLGVGVVAVGAAVFLGGQRTLAGTGSFEDEFRARYGGNAITASAASLDLSLSSSTETFGRLWYQRGALPPRWGAYTLQFLGKRVQPLTGKTDMYGITAQLSAPYYMNTATFVAIPLLDYGPAGAALFLLLLGGCVGLGERALDLVASPAGRLGLGFIVYFSLFGIYELYPAIYPTWLSIVPGLWLLHRLGRSA